MNAHEVSLGFYGLVAVTGAVLEVRARRRGSRVPTLGAVVSKAMETRSGRVGLIAGWAWIGMHFFAK